MASSSTSIPKTDVLIVGGGPVGLLIALQLTKFGSSAYVVEQDDKSQLPIYGRACTLWPRTVELLDQLDLADDMLQEGIVSTNSLHFREGKRLTGGYMYASRMDKLDTGHKYAFHLRQRLIEQQLEAALLECGNEVNSLRRIQSYVINESAEDGYPVTATIVKTDTEETYQVKTKYLVGADGGRSPTRKLASIPFTGDRSAYQWVRIDAKVKIDMPNSRYLNSIDSPTHGQLLWCPIDNGFTRIGYVFSDELAKKYGVNASGEGFTKEMAMAEAERAVAPFKIEWETCDWFVLYGIGQRIAETFFTQDRVFLAGDACHTHSSGSAQGLNTGTHDAVNLGWKLSLVLRGLATPDLLKSYNDERRPIVQQVIDNDKCISKLISGHLPERFEGRKELPRDILTEWFTDLTMQSFTLGLGISYSTSILNMPGEVSSYSTINPGERGPDAPLVKIGTGDFIRLHTALKNEGKFHILIFAGIPTLTKPHLSTLHTALSSPSLRALHNPRLFRWTTLSATPGPGTFDVFGFHWAGPRAGGKVYFDPEGKAHALYGVDLEKGAAVVLRPDGWVSAVVGLEVGEMERLAGWLGGVVNLEG